MKVLVTSGPTREPIDSVRFISNLSSGRTGAAICAALVARGFDVTQLRGADSSVAGGVTRHESFTDHASLDRNMCRLLAHGRYDAVIHAAAVGDYSVAGGAPDVKLASGQELVLRLAPTPKIIDRIRSYAANPGLLLVGFKLTHAADPSDRLLAVQDLMRRSGADYIVQNDVATLGDDAGHVYIIHSGKGENPVHCTGARALAASLVTLLEQAAARSHA